MNLKAVRKKMQHFCLSKLYKIFLVFFLISCSTVIEEKSDKYFVEEGLASWYGKEYNGQKTASGEIFNMYDFTAAHRTLPFGTIVEVFSYDTQKKVNVKINDRGPFLPKRIIDLSYSAAKSLGIINLGLSKVKIRAKGIFEIKEQKELKLIIQVGAFKNKENAENLKEKLKQKYPKIYTEKFGEFKRVLIGPFSSEEEAGLVFEQLKKDGFTPIVRKL